MKWVRIEPDQENWKEQYDLTAYYGEQVIGSIVMDNDGTGDWFSVIDGKVEYMGKGTMKEAREAFYERLDEHITDQKNYYEEISRMLQELRDETE